MNHLVFALASFVCTLSLLDWMTGGLLLLSLIPIVEKGWKRTTCSMEKRQVQVAHDAQNQSIGTDCGPKLWKLSEWRFGAPTHALSTLVGSCSRRPGTFCRGWIVPGKGCWGTLGDTGLGREHRWELDEFLNIGLVLICFNIRKTSSNHNNDPHPMFYFSGSLTLTLTLWRWLMEIAFWRKGDEIRDMDPCQEKTAELCLICCTNTSIVWLNM